MEGRSLVPAFKGGEIEREAHLLGARRQSGGPQGQVETGAQREQGVGTLRHRRPTAPRCTTSPQTSRNSCEKLAAEWQAYADRANVSPVGTWSGRKPNPKQASNKRERFELRGGDDLPQEKAPNISGRGLRIEGTVNSQRRDGVIVAQGGSSQGYALILNQGTLQFLTRVDGKITQCAMPMPAPKGKFSFLAKMSPDGKVQLNAGRSVHLGNKVAPLKVMPIDGLQVGRDTGGCVGEYASEFALDGEIELTLTLLPEVKSPKPAATAKPNPMTPIEDTPGLPRVLLIGDSISIGYTLPVRGLLEGKANVHRPPTNCASTRHGLKSIDGWLGDGKWDVIHFNWGLHDLKFVAPGTEQLADQNDPKNARQVPPDEYEKNLRELVARLKKTGAKSIWCSTTPGPVGARGRIPGDSARYNAIAKKIMDGQRDSDR